MYLWKRDLNEKDLKDLIERLNENASLAYHIIVSFGDCDFEKFALEKLGDFDKIVSCRIFGTATEIHFRRLNDSTFRTVVTSESKLPGLDNMESKDLEVSNNKSYYLWGKKLDSKTWFETRIPRLLPYPLDAPEEFVKLKAVEYRNKESGLVEFIRFNGIEGEGEEGREEEEGK